VQPVLFDWPSRKAAGRAAEAPAKRAMELCEVGKAGGLRLILWRRKYENRPPEGGRQERGRGSGGYSAGLPTTEAWPTVSRARITSRPTMIASMTTKATKAPVNEPPEALMIAPISQGATKAEKIPNTSA